eukprot:TRINITY_DN4149_c0_g1_i1.p3 TRINITY_DN4149_c0_g1~~TRINITY_DN4149_c0_g1_i1.p3  ORF type:complete len:122 (-),score=9.67 TRINITY_DN4149_c0_g1_i1:348-713(-)
MYQFCGGVFIMVVLVQGVFNRELQEEQNVPGPDFYEGTPVKCIVNPCYVASCPGVPEAVCHSSGCGKPIWYLGQCHPSHCGKPILYLWHLIIDTLVIVSESECQGSGSDLVTGIDGEEENY